MENLAFTDKKNKVSELTESQKQTIAQDYGAKRWKNTRELDLATVIDDSKKAWDFILNNVAGSSGDSPSVATIETAKTQAQSRRLRLGKIPEVVFTLLSMQHSATFPSGDRFFRSLPCNQEAKEGREKYETYLAEAHGEANTDYNFWLFWLNAIVDGTSLAAVPYKRKSRKKTVYKPMQIGFPPFVITLPFTESKVEEVVEWEGTCLEPLNLNEWVADPWAKSLDDAWLLRRWYQPAWQIEEQYKLEKDSVKSYDRNWDTSDEDTIRKEILGQLTRSITGEPEGKHEALVMAVYDDFKLDGVLYKNHVAIVVNDVDVVWFGSLDDQYNHGKKPFVLAPYYPLPNQLYGLSAIKHVIPSAEVIDDMTDVALANGRLGTKPIMIYRSDEEAFGGEAVPVELGMMYPVKNIEGAIRAVEIPMPNVSYLQYFIDSIKKHIEDHTGASPLFSGQDPSSGEKPTAFQVSQHAQSGSVKFQAIVKNWHNTAIEPFLRMVHENYQQFLSEPKYVSGYDKPLTPDEVRMMEFKWTLTSNTAAQAVNQQLQQGMMLIQELIPLGMRQGWMRLKGGITEVDVNAAFRSLLQTAKMENVDDIIKTINPEEMMNDPRNPAAQLSPVSPMGEQRVSGGNGGVPVGIIPATNDGAGLPAADVAVGY